MLRLDVTNRVEGAAEKSAIEFSDRAVKAAAFKLGWSETIDDPSHADQVDAVDAERAAAPRNSPERRAKEFELAQLRQRGPDQIPNPQTYARFVIEKVSETLNSLLVDERVAQQEAEQQLRAALEASIAAQKSEFAGDITVEDPTPIT